MGDNDDDKEECIDVDNNTILEGGDEEFTNSRNEFTD